VPRNLAPAALSGLLLAFATEAALAQIVGQPVEYPTTQFEGDSLTASVSEGDLTATVTVVPPPDDQSGYIPVLTVSVDGLKVAEATGTETDFNEPSAVASIAQIDPGNPLPEVYFTSYSGGAHCCTTIIVASQAGDKWVTVPVGDFDGDGDYLADLDGDGFAEIVTVDNRFLYQFDSYAASAAPLVIFTLRDGEVVDVTTETRFLPAHREWLAHVEESIEPADRWTSRGFLAGWLGEKVRLGEGPNAWEELNANWDFAADPGEEICLTGEQPEDCAEEELKTVKFPEQLRLFLTQNGYAF
jgi:hypothetical protein